MGDAFFWWWWWFGGGGGVDVGLTNKVYNGLCENGELVVFNSCFVLPFAMPL